MKQQDGCSERDEQLIQRIIAKDERALSDLFALHSERIFRYVLRLTQSETVAEEVTNDVVLEVWSAAGKFRGASQLTTWLLGIARFKAINAIRGKQPQWANENTLAELQDNLYDIESAVMAQERQRVALVIRNAMREMSLEHRDVLDLTFFHGRSYAEIAKIVDAPVATVRTRMHYAKQALRQALGAAADGQLSDLVG